MTVPPICKLIISSEGPTLEALVDARFGRAGGFVVVDLATLATTYVDNGSSQILAQGAGIQAVENILKAGAQALLTGHVGPKAFAALQAVGMKVIQGVENMTVGEAVSRFQAGQLAFSDAPSH
jgi:predicted Fe-Mo cluster-binding NifX family protein